MSQAGVRDRETGVGFRVAILNLEQDHKRWLDRRELIVDQLEHLQPDVLALNEVCIPLQTGRYLQQAATRRLGVDYLPYAETTPIESAILEDSPTSTPRWVPPLVEFSFRANLLLRFHTTIIKQVSSYCLVAIPKPIRRDGERSHSQYVAAMFRICRNLQAGVG